MDRYTFHGPLSVEDLANALISEFNHGTRRAQALGDDEVCVVQITSIRNPASGGRTALSIHLTKIEDGVQIQFGQQEWLGVAASLGKTALGALLRPATLLARLDDLAVDIKSLQLKDQVQETIDRVAKAAGASFELSERLRRLTCAHCSTANPVGEPHCIACGAPMGPSQPVTCPHCGFVTSSEEILCPDCGKKIS